MEGFGDPPYRRKTTSWDIMRKTRALTSIENEQRQSSDRIDVLEAPPDLDLC